MRMTPIEKGIKEGVNKYGQEKVWQDEGKNEAEFVSADDSLAYVSTPRRAMITDGITKENEIPETVVETTGTEEDKYKRVDYKKRYDDLKRHYDKMINEKKEEIGTLKAQISSATPQYKPPSTPEELEEFRTTNPGLYNVVESLAHQRSTSEAARLKEEMEALKEKLAYVEAEKAYALLKAAVPNYDEYRTSDDFHEWAESQPKEIQDWVYNNRTNVDLAVRAIRLYEADRKVAQPVTTQQAPPARAPRADEYIPARQVSDDTHTAERVWKTSEIARLSSAQYEKYSAEIDRAFLEGRVQRDTK